MGEPAARGIGVLEEQKLEVAIQRPALMGGERLPVAVQSPNPQQLCAGTPTASIDPRFSLAGTKVLTLSLSRDFRRE